MRSNESILETIELLKSTSQFINGSRGNLCSPYGITPTQAIILLDIAHHPTQTKITDICKRLDKTTNTISPLVNRMMDKGYLYKKQNEEDNRIFEVFFTSKGKEIMNQINLDVLKFAAPIFDQLTNEEFESLYRSVKKLNEVCNI